jgi:1-aminocyclopropane-1-carboxylate deaminase/D-cysteine desulfhydrase-like pyridoxal-dependent ACC family enzyme
MDATAGRGPLLAHLPTPVEPADRLGVALGLGAGRLWVKRDDCTGLAGGGNKARKLEALCADALARGCTTLVTAGGPQSNHVRMTAAAANKLGLGCTVLLMGDEAAEPTGNVVIDLLLGPEILWVGRLGYDEADAAVAAEAERLTAAGRPAYPIPIGGATPVGSQGYVAAVAELESQLPDVALVVTADGSGGTHAGLAAGFGDFARVLGVDVGARAELVAALPVLAGAAAVVAGRPAPAGAPVVDHDHVGPAYAAPTPEGREAAGMAARLEGLGLDPVYSAKAMAALVTAARRGTLPDGRVVFLHTGGMPALFAEGMAAWARG